MAILRISRDSGYADYVRSYCVLLDGKEIGRIANGETKNFRIAAGNHELRLKLDWAGSRTLKFAARDTDTMAFRVSSNLRGWRLLLALWYAVFDTTSYLVLEPDTSESVMS